MLLLLSDQNCSNRRDRTDRGSCQCRCSGKVELAIPKHEVLAAFRRSSPVFSSLPSLFRICHLVPPAAPSQQRTDRTSPAELFSDVSFGKNFPKVFCVGKERLVPPLPVSRIKSRRDVRASPVSPAIPCIHEWWAAYSTSANLSCFSFR
jgi:hypothetical protein